MKDIVVSGLWDGGGMPAGSVVVPCTRCVRLICISQVSQARIEGGLLAYCMACALLVALVWAAKTGEVCELVMPWEKGDQ